MRSGWVRRGGNLRTLSGPRGSSSKEDILGAAGLPIRSFDLMYEPPREMFLGAALAIIVQRL
jgi:hypothetical protein